LAARTAKAFPMPSRSVAALLLVTLASVGVFLRESPASADDGMRCGSRFVSLGDTQYDVRALCGEPDATDRRVLTRTEIRRIDVPCFRDQFGVVRCQRASAVQVEVVIDEWTYDFGTQRFVRLATFENGRLALVSTGGYGHK
jgi:hypothetical protein